jgi:hypothetical protein
MEHSLCGAENWKLKNIDRKYIESIAMSCWKRMEKSIGLIVCKMESQGRKEHSTHSNIKKVKWIGYILCKSCLPKRVIKRNIEGKGDGTKRQEGRRKQLLNDVNEMLKYWNMKNGTPWRTCFRRGCGLLRKRDYGMKNHITVTAS